MSQQINPWASVHPNEVTGNPQIYMNGGLSEIGLIYEMGGWRLQLSGPAGIIQAELTYPQMIQLMRALFGRVEDLASERHIQEKIRKLKEKG